MLCSVQQYKRALITLSGELTVHHVSAANPEQTQVSTEACLDRKTTAGSEAPTSAELSAEVPALSSSLKIEVFKV